MHNRLAKPWITAAALLGLIVSIWALDISKLSGSSTGRWMHNLTPDYTRINPDGGCQLLIALNTSGEAQVLGDSVDPDDLETSQVYSGIGPSVRFVRGSSASHVKPTRSTSGSRQRLTARPTFRNNDARCAPLS